MKIMGKMSSNCFKQSRILLFLLTYAVSGQEPQVGVRIPSFTLPDQFGQVQSFESIRGPKGAMLVFYRSADWCTFCKSQLMELERSREDLKKRGLGLAAISYDSVATLRFFADRKRIGFPLLSDEDSTAIRAFGLLNEEVPKASEFYGVPHPVTYIVDAKGVVTSRVFDEDFRRRSTVGNLVGLKASAVPVQAKRLELIQRSSDRTVNGGHRIRLTLEIQLPQRSHVYAPGVKGYIPIDWRLPESPSYEVMPVTYPQPRSLYLKPIDETVPVYEGKLILEREVVAAQRLTTPDLTIIGELRYQVCDDKQCYVPETAPLNWTLKYEPHDTIRAPMELRRKRR